MTGLDSRSQNEQQKFNPNTVAQDIYKKVAKYGHTAVIEAIDLTGYSFEEFMDSKHDY